MNGVLTLSKKEIDRVMIIKQIEENKITVLEAAEKLAISQRQIYRIIKGIRLEGIKGIIHKLRGKASNRGYPKEIKKKVIEIYKKQYWDYGPTLCSEMLLKYHNITINRETIRRWLRENSIATNLRKKRPHRRKRERRNCYGELLQLDGSYHDWF
ncbi:MAG: helix-turn-helix domain-containing protein, partial [Ignavibacteria bacterium]